MRQRFSDDLTFSVATSYLNKEKAAAVFAFGREQLTPRAGLLDNSKLRPVLIDYYRKGFTD